MDKSKQVLFNIEMVKAIQEGRKTQTRRAFDPNKIFEDNEDVHRIGIVDGKIVYDAVVDADMTHEDVDITENYSMYKKGDILWVREPAKILDCFGTQIRYIYLSDGHIDTIYLPKRFLQWKKGDPEIIVPKWVKNKAGVPNGCIREMARTFLRITGVRAERIQDISERDIYREGLETAKEPVSGDTMYGFGIDEVDGVVGINERDAFRYLWAKTAPKGCQWDDNPYVFVYDFEVIDKEQKDNNRTSLK